MANETEITISGIEAVCEALDKLPAQMAKVIIAKSLIAASVPIVQAIRALCPVETGDLKDHVKADVRISADGLGGKARIGFGDMGHIAKFVELGHVEVGHEKEGYPILGQVQPHPFVRAAFAESVNDAVEAFRDAALQAIQELPRQN